MALRTEVTLSTAFEAAVVDRARPLISPERSASARSRGGTPAIGRTTPGGTMDAST